jgi:bilirubin oxidase
MLHCHNLVHEDHDMMAAFNVSKVDLTTFGYPDTINFIDPMAPLFRAKPITGPTDLGQIQSVVLPYFQNLDAYPDGLVIEQALKDYYKNGGPKTGKPVTSATVPTTLATSTKSDDSPKTTSAPTKTEDKPKTTTA